MCNAIQIKLLTIRYVLSNVMVSCDGVACYKKKVTKCVSSKM